MDAVGGPHVSVGEEKIPFFLTAAPPCASLGRRRCAGGRAPPRPSRARRRASSALAAALLLYDAALSPDSPVSLSLHHYLLPETSRRHADAN
jgi:hypothetical protein